jgi:hypothetical protein
MTVGQGGAAGGICHRSQVGDACRVAQASWDGHSGRDCRHKRQVVGQFQQVSNRYDEGDLPIYEDALILALKDLFAPTTRPSLFIEEHGRTSLVCTMGRPEGVALDSALGSVKVL